MKKQFKESLQSAVFTSDYIISKKSSIVYIAHHDDGTWEFWGNEIVTEREIRIVSLAQIIKIDPTVLEVADMPVEFNAIRESKNLNWKITSKN
jgi:hypothetical protein